MADKRDDMETFAMASSCRFYEQEYPEADDVVVVLVNNVEELGAYVSLLEYNNIDGMILASELSRRRIRSMNNVIRVGKIETCVVLRVDKEKGYIDLSKRRVNEDDIKSSQEKYNNAKQVHSILARVASLSNTTLEHLYESFGWDLYKRFGHAYDAFNRIVNGDTSVLNEYNLDASIIENLTTVIKHRLTPRPTAIRATIDATCFGYEGIDGIKEALKAGMALSTPEMPIKIRLLAPPQYVITTVAVSAAEGIKLVEDAIDTISKVLATKEGQCKVIEAPKLISDKEEANINDEIAKLNEQNKLVPADDEDEDDDEDEEDEE